MLSAATLPRKKQFALKIGLTCPKRKQYSYSNHPFSGVFAVSFREGTFFGKTEMFHFLFWMCVCVCVCACFCVV